MLEIIDTKAEWDKTCEKMVDLDVYYDYNFAQSFAEIEDGQLLAAYFEKNNSKIFYPFIIREVNLTKLSITFNDIVTPYGYGGLHIEGKDDITTEFLDDFKKYCLTKNIVTETIRFHPLLVNHKYFNKKDKRYIRKTTSVDLIQDIEEIRSNYRSMNKRNIKKARKNNIEVFEANVNDENLSIFKKLYDETMNRNNANDYYYFDLAFFKKQMSKTSLCQPKLLFASYKGEVIAGVILLIGNRFSHYHLGASKTDYLDLRPNNLLFDYMIEVCKEQGSNLLHLGGGYSEDDGLFKYKASFTNNHNHEYYLGTVIHNHELYNKLNKYFKENYDINEEFFPIYRAINNN